MPAETNAPREAPSRTAPAPAAGPGRRRARARPPSRRAALALLAGALAAGACGRERAAGDRAAGPAWAGRDVVLLVTDSVAAGRLGCYGGARATSPELDALAARGVRFAQARSQSAWTVPSVATCFTGLEQEQHGVRHLEDVLPEERATLAEAFAARGYHTVALVQTPLVRAAGGFGRGFGRWRGWSGAPGRSELAVAEAEAELAAARDAPLFLYVHLTPPHMPYDPPPPWRGRFGAADADGSVAECRRVHRAGLAPDHPDVLALAARYAEHVAYADALLGRVARAADRAGAVLIATSDHGEAFMEHGAQGHNASVYEEMVRVPLVVADPAGTLVAGRVVAAPASLLDLAPTLAELCGLAALDGGPGRSLAAELLGASTAAEERALFLSSRYGSPAGLQVAVVRGDWKLVARGGAVELFDLTRDSGERRDLAGDPAHAERLAALRAVLARWRAARARADGGPAELLGGAPPEPDAPRAAPLAPDERAALRALGYLDDGRSR